MNTFFNNQELGYYQVGEVKHLRKVSALIDGTNRNIHPVWNFNNEIFDQYDWSVEPIETLQELYGQRAKEIREKYDYIMLLYSGGADSQAMLDSFLNNNLKVDEIVVLHPFGLEKTYTPDRNNFEPINFLSEWDFTMKPKLNWLAQHYPKIKITMIDWSEDILDFKINDGFVLNRNHNVSPYNEIRNEFSRFKNFKSALEKYNRVGIILGVDKPRICFYENAYRLYFLDIITSGTGPGSTEHNHVPAEFFYWHPSSCKLLAKQAHQLVKFFQMFPAFKTYITWPMTNPTNRTWYENSIKAIIYPDLDLNFFQANKFKVMSIGYDQLLFKIGLQDKILGMHQENFSYLKKVIDPKYFNDIDGIPAFVGFISKMRPLLYT